jgi:uncharacterized protein
MIKRSLEKELKRHLQEPEMSLIVGPRQAGKTTLMRGLQQHLESSGKRTLWLSLDRMADEQYFSTQETLVQKIQEELGRAEGYVFIDEIQRKENAGRWLKGLYDIGLPYKFIVSGSGSVELKEKIHESMAGRKRVFELTTVSLGEFLNWKTAYRYEDDVMGWIGRDRLRAEPLVDEYLRFGGYPRVVTAETTEEKRHLMEEIYQSYLARDVSELLQVKKPRVFSHLVQILVSQAGRLANVAELARTLAISEATVKDYLWYLEKTYVAGKVTPFYRNTRKELTKAATYYFTDIGLANFSQGMFGEEARGGWRWQNLVFLLLQERIRASGTNRHLHFWRTGSGAEVDFVIEQGDKITPVEAKDSALKKPFVSRSLRSFIKSYQPAQALVVNRQLIHEERIGQTAVKFVTLASPAWREFKA